MNGLQDFEKPFKGYIKDWSIKAHDGKAFIIGKFVDHPEFAGQHGYTSYIVSKKDSEGYWEVETLNSRYKLNYEDEYIENN